MERLEYIEIQLIKVGKALEASEANGMPLSRVKLLERYVEQLKHEKEYLYIRMMKEKAY